MQEQASEHARRHPRPGASDRLILTELAPGAVIDHLDDDGSPVELITFGTVRETCPRCRQTHLEAGPAPAARAPGPSVLYRMPGLLRRPLRQWRASPDHLSARKRAPHACRVRGGSAWYRGAFRHCKPMQQFLTLLVLDERLRSRRYQAALALFAVIVITGSIPGARRDRPAGLGRHSAFHRLCDPDLSAVYRAPAAATRCAPCAPC
ncbi:hypothetical protein LP420_09670 [Massilia sp. B-10]|nr:hypothetical protein LP420_09670 [Massilia sp. B-10]